MRRLSRYHHRQLGGAVWGISVEGLWDFGRLVLDMLQSVAAIFSLLLDFPNFSPALTPLCPTKDANYDFMATIITL